MREVIKLSFWASRPCTKKQTTGLEHACKYQLPLRTQTALNSQDSVSLRRRYVADATSRAPCIFLRKKSRVKSKTGALGARCLIFACLPSRLKQGKSEGCLTYTAFAVPLSATLCASTSPSGRGVHTRFNPPSGPAWSTPATPAPIACGRCPIRRWRRPGSRPIRAAVDRGAYRPASRGRRP